LSLRRCQPGRSLHASLTTQMPDTRHLHPRACHSWIDPAERVRMRKACDMRILITGTTGFVGRHIAAALVTDGDEVHGLVRSAASASSLAHSGVRLHEGDMRAPDSYRHLIPEVDAVIHAAQLATAGRVTAARARSVFDADRIMTTALADGCLQHG